MDKTVCDEIIDVKETNFNENITCERQSFYFTYVFVNQHQYW